MRLRLSLPEGAAHNRKSITRYIMKTFATDFIRNIALIGHSGEGKTSLAEAMLFETKSIDRLGKVDDGTATMDFDDEEIKRKISISMALATAVNKGIQ